MQRSPFLREETFCGEGSLHKEEALSEEAPNRVALCKERMPFVEVSCREVIDTERRPFVEEAPCREVPSAQGGGPCRGGHLYREDVTCIEAALETGIAEETP